MKPRCLPHSSVVRSSGRPAQRGAGALAVTLILLFVLTLVVFYVNRGLIFEQRASANQYRATAAFETADAGIEWAIGLLNENRPVNANCSIVSGGTNFRSRYVNPSGQTLSITSAIQALRPGCVINADRTLACQCPSATPNPALATTDRPRFVVRFEPVTGDSSAVRISAKGCSNYLSECSFESGSTRNADAEAIVSVILKTLPVIRGIPGSTVTAGGNVTGTSGGGSISIENADPTSGGVTIDAGGTIEADAVDNVKSTPGTPRSASLVQNDPELQALASDATGESMFKAFFGGQTTADYRDNPGTTRFWNTNTSGSVPTTGDWTACSNALDCGSKIAAAWKNDLAQQIWVQGDAAFNNSTLNGAGIPSMGTQDVPLMLVTSGEMQINGGIDFYGLLYSNDISLDYSGSGNANVHGAMIARNNINKLNGNTTLFYDPTALGNLSGDTSRLVRLPGSWFDCRIQASSGALSCN